MALIDAVKAACRRLAPMGWAERLQAHGLDITKPDLTAELARVLEVDRGKPGFEDFCRSGTRGIEPGVPAKSLLYHALASPRVHPTADEAPGPNDAYPTLAELDAVENYIYGLEPFDVPDLTDYVIAVFAYQYRPASATAHGYHADLVFSRTGVARVGTGPLAWDGPSRAFRADPAGRTDVAACPARYAAFLAIRRHARSDDAIMGRRDQDDRRRTFLFPAHKLFAGSRCVADHTLALRFREYHRSDKLRRIHRVGRVRLVRGFDVDAPPFVRDSTNGGDLVQIRPAGASVLVVPRHHGALARMARQRNSVSRRTEIVRFVVPSSDTHERFETSLLLEPPDDARRAPEYVNIRHRVVPKGAGHAVEDMQALDSDAFDRLIERGGYEAAHFVDDTCDGVVVAVVEGLPERVPSAAAYSLVTAPDFFPLSDQLEITNWVRQNFQNHQEHFAQGAPWPLCEGRHAANIELPRPDAPRTKAFAREDETVTAIVGTRPHSLETHAPARRKRFASFLPDAASNEFAPGWDVSLGTDGRTIYCAAYGLGSPFPEDAKLCAALNSYWPAVAPDASRTFKFESPTAIPLLDPELGYHPDHPKVRAGLVPPHLGWDGEHGPFFEPVDGAPHVNFASLRRSDYVSNALRKTLTVRRTASVDSDELIRRMRLLRRCIALLPPPNDPVSRTRLWLVEAEAVPDWASVPGRANARLTGPGYIYVFVTVAGTARPTADLRRLRIRVADRYTCQATEDALYWRRNEADWQTE